MTITASTGVLPGFAAAAAASLGTRVTATPETKVGWAIDAGVKFNLPWFGAGDSFLVTGAYSQNAVWYSGLPDGMWGENGQVNGNGQPMYLADAFFNPLTNPWSTPTAWSVSALLEHHWTPQFYTDLEGSIGGSAGATRAAAATSLRLGCGIASGDQGALSPKRHQLDRRRGLRLEPGHQPELRPRVDVSEHEPGSGRAGSSGRSTTSAARRRGLRSGRLGRQLERLRWPFPHHPLLLIPTRSDETRAPERKLRGFSCSRVSRARRTARIERGRRGILRLRIRAAAGR